MSRVKKLLIVGLVLAVGTGLAWPFRKTSEPDTLAELSPIAPMSTFESLDERGGLSAPLLSKESAPRHTAAKMASTGDSAITPTRQLGETGFDLADHPALSHQPVLKSSEGEPKFNGGEPPARPAQPDSRPAYATAEVEKLVEVLHVVRNTDTLEKLAKRYLGDEGRALEIFDLNREQLSNPHLLPIGAKLRIPGQTLRESD